ncbi:MAG: rRNA ((1402)-N(4))-methyltransferase RsmH [Pseudomonadota bacterium]|jgi:16S rRNA (cytosine1402-N4)-methyltransferase
MSTFQHVTVLKNETVDALVQLLDQAPPQKAFRFADCTLGGAGHTLRLLEQISEHSLTIAHPQTAFELYCCDQDPLALQHSRERIAGWFKATRQSESRFQVHFLELNFRHFPDWFKTNKENEKLDGLMADLGVSSPQLDDAERGFSFLRDGPLDMRMNTHQETTARDLLLTLSERELAEIFTRYGEEPKSRLLAKAIVKDRQAQVLPLSNTVTFAQYVSRILSYHNSRVHPATRVFQALRIAVNEELAAIEELLNDIPLIMAPGGRAAIISFHSLEDRIVKKYFRAWEAGMRTPDLKNENEQQQRIENQMGLIGNPASVPRPFGKESPRGGVVASADELSLNPRSRSARLRTFAFDGNENHR